jgi:hypothetical protein
MCIDETLNPSLVEKTDLKYAKEFWTLSNVVTGFSVVQGLTFGTVVGPHSGALFCAITEAIPITCIGIVISTILYESAILFCWFTRNRLLKEHKALSKKLKRAFNIWLGGQMLVVTLFAILSFLIVFWTSPLEIKKCSQGVVTTPMIAPAPKDKFAQTITIGIRHHL